MFSTISPSQRLTTTRLTILACGESTTTPPQNAETTEPATAINATPHLGSSPTIADSPQQEFDQTPSATTTAALAQPGAQLLAGDFHLDPAPPTRVRPKRKRVSDIELTLRSTLPGAIASVDGQPVGPTPAYWSGPKNSIAREFTFTLPGYALARYRFVPTRSGVVHGTLHRLVAPVLDDNNKHKTNN